MPAELSVVVPAFNRADILPRTLDALANQDLESSRYRVLVVDDGSTDATAEVVARFVDSRPGLFEGVVHQENRGLSAARNSGWRAARSDLVLFLDADLVSCPVLVGAHLETHAVHPQENRAVLGHVGYPPEDARTPLRDFGNQVSRMWGDTENMVGKLLDWRFFLGGNVSLKRSLLEKSGGFNEERFVGSEGFEDWELGVRLCREFGLGILFAPEAVAYHYHWREPAAVMANMRAYGRTLARWLAGNEELRESVLTATPAFEFLQDRLPWKPWLRERCRRLCINSLTVPVMLGLAKRLERRWEWASAALYWKTGRYLIRKGFLEQQEATRG